MKVPKGYKYGFIYRNMFDDTNGFAFKSNNISDIIKFIEEDNKDLEAEVLTVNSYYETDKMKQYVVQVKYHKLNEVRTVGYVNERKSFKNG